MLHRFWNTYGVKHGRRNLDYGVDFFFLPSLSPSKYTYVSVIIGYLLLPYFDQIAPLFIFAIHIRYTFRGIWFLWKKVFWFTFYNADTSIKRTLFLGPNGVHFREIPHTAKKCFSLKVDWFRYWLWYAILWS